MTVVLIPPAELLALLPHVLATVLPQQQPRTAALAPWLAQAGWPVVL